MATSHLTEVYFKVHAPVRHGEEVRLLGNHPALGCNDIQRAIELVTSPAEYPLWSNQKAIFVPNDCKHIKYRYCIFSGGKFVRFEGESGDKYFERSLNLVQSNDGTNSTNDYLDALPTEDNRFRRLSSRSSYDVGASTFDHRVRKYAVTGSKLDKETISETDNITVVSYFLPIVLSKEGRKWSAVWDYEHLLSFQTNLNVKWVGSVRYEHGFSSEDEEIITDILRSMNCFPIFIQSRVHHTFYDVFCKQRLWPVFHHVVGVYGDGPDPADRNPDYNDKSLWFTYTTVNHMFRKKVVEVFSEGDLIWIHGFHLLLLPSFLRRRMYAAKIGLFLHTPFPSSEIWKTLWCREELLRGMLAADQIGFHLYEYARHFSTTCRRLLGTHYEMSASGYLTIMAYEREVRLSCCHAGVDVYHINNLVARDDFLDEAVLWRKKFHDKCIISSIDRLERLKGIPLKLITLEVFATQNPDLLSNLVFVIIGVSAPEREEDYHATSRDVKSLVRNINKKFPGLVHYEERTEDKISLFGRLALFSVSDVLMISGTRDGLNRYPMEYTLARYFAGKIYCFKPPSDAGDKAMSAGSSFINLMSGKSLEELLLESRSNAPLSEETLKKSSMANFDCDGCSAVICSEFASCARVMRGSFTVNPWRPDEITSAIKRALLLDSVDKGRRTRRNLEFCQRMSSFSWAEIVLQDLKQTPNHQEDSLNKDHETLGLGINYRVTEFKSGFEELDIVKLTKHYRLSNERLILLDWGGTLVEENDVNNKFQYYAVATGHASRAGPSDEIKQSLAALCQDTRNTVFVISGKDLYALNDAFGDVEGLGLVAEHGCYFKWPRNVSGDRFTYKMRKKWQTMLNLGDTSWMNAVRQIMNIYVERTHGTYIEQKGSAIIFQFRDADPEFGYLQSKELEENLNDIVLSYPIEILRGGGIDDGYIEVRPQGLSKGLFLKHAISILSSQGKTVDFILGIGDDASDEAMFESIHRIKNLGENCFSVTVGKKASSAQAYVDDAFAVKELLFALEKTSQRCRQLDRKYFSALDLTASGRHSLGNGQWRRDPDARDSPNTTTKDVQVRVSTSSFMKRSSSESKLPRERTSSGDQNEQSKSELFDFLKKSNASPTLSPSTLSPGLQDSGLSSARMDNIYEQEEEDDEGIYF